MGVSTLSFLPAALSSAEMARVLLTLRGELAATRGELTATRAALAASELALAAARQEITDLRTQLQTVALDRERRPRGECRHAAPFSQGTRKPDPKKPGRKPGQGTFTRRLAPPPEQIAETIAVPAPPGGCPKCGGALEACGVETVTITELPPPPPPVVTAYTIPRCRCVACGQTVRGQHPEVAADQLGATAHRLGDRALATAHWLHYGVGIPVRQVPKILWELRGLQVTQSALTQAALRESERTVGGAYQALRDAVATRPVTYTDDTSWRIGGETAFLMGFETGQERVFQIRTRHRNEEVREIVPGTFSGVLVTDRGRSYDANLLAEVRQQKCLDHLHRSTKEVLAVVQGKHREFPERLGSLLWEARNLWKAHQAQEMPEFTAERARLDTALKELLTAPDQPLHPANERLQDDLRWRHHCGDLLRFLYVPGVEPTNNRAERLLRPAVIARKVSQCSKNSAGAKAFSAFKSVTCTLGLRGAKALIDGLARVMRTGKVPAAPT